MARTRLLDRLPSAAEVASTFWYSREERAQRALSSLILGHEPPAWNAADSPTRKGAEFLRRLDGLAFGSQHSGEPAFVDEFELQKRHLGEKNRSPDYGVVWDDRLLLIELKTEKASHRSDQCADYLARGKHHYPAKQVDLIYLTPLMTAPVPPVPIGARYAHVDWPLVERLIDAIWSDSPDPSERELAAFLSELIGGLDRPPSTGLTQLPLESRLPEQRLPESDRTHSALAEAELVAADRRQRGIGVTADSPEQLDVYRVAVHDMLLASNNPELSHVRPWIWRQENSGGKPLTELGASSGYELRMSYYARAAAS
jgi:hypothetical protein